MQVKQDKKFELGSGTGTYHPVLYFCVFLCQFGIFGQMTVLRKQLRVLVGIIATYMIQGK